MICARIGGGACRRTERAPVLGGPFGVGAKSNHRLPNSRVSRMWDILPDVGQVRSYGQRPECRLDRSLFVLASPGPELATSRLENEEREVV